MSERGPLDLIRADELIWLRPGARFDHLVAADLAVLDPLDGKLVAAARDIDRAGGSGSDDGLGAVISEMVWQLGDLDGVLHTGQLEQASRGVDDFARNLDERDETLQP